jgi:hypothetical protein
VDQPPNPEPDGATQANVAQTGGQRVPNGTRVPNDRPHNGGDYDDETDETDQTHAPDDPLLLP